MKISRDINGNKTIIIQNTDLKGERGFSIQTMGNLPHTHRNGLDPENTVTEVKNYINEYGTTRQKRLLSLL